MYLSSGPFDADITVEYDTPYNPVYADNSHATTIADKIEIGQAVSSQTAILCFPTFKYTHTGTINCKSLAVFEFLN